MALLTEAQSPVSRDDDPLLFFPEESACIAVILGHVQWSENTTQGLPVIVKAARSDLAEEWAGNVLQLAHVTA